MFSIADGWLESVSVRLLESAVYEFYLDIDSTAGVPADKLE